MTRRSLGVTAWGIGMGVTILCCILAGITLIYTGFQTEGQVCAAALLSISLLALFGGRMAARWAGRPRRRRLDFY